MEWTEQDEQNLRNWRQNIDNEDIRIKEKIKELLLDNKTLIHVLNNEELEKAGAEPDEYYYVNILPYYIIYPTQTNVQNYVCYETNFERVSRVNNIIKYNQIVFTILCEQKGIVEKSTGLARHDLIASLILDQFNWSNYFGQQIVCVSDKTSVSDNSYACRTLIFQSETPLNILRTEQKTRVINNEVRDGISH